VLCAEAEGLFVSMRADRFSELKAKRDQLTREADQ
jgi:hypothetical protein